MIWESYCHEELVSYYNILFLTKILMELYKAHA